MSPQPNGGGEAKCAERRERRFVVDEQNQAVEAEEPNGTEEIDYKAKYEETLKHSREWERKAKANKGAKDELDKLKEAQMTETERLQKQVADYKATADALMAEKERNSWIKQAAAESGVDADILALVKAEDLDDLKSKAAFMAEKINGKAEEPEPSVPVVLGDGKHAEAKPTGDAKDDFAKFMKTFK